MTDLRTRLQMAWAVLRGRSVMYRWHGTANGMIPKTLGAISVENTGLLAARGDPTVDDAAADVDRRSAAGRSVPEVLDLRSEPVRNRSGKRLSAEIEQHQHHGREL